MTTPIYQVWSDVITGWITRPIASRAKAFDIADCLAASYPNDTLSVAEFDATRPDLPEKFIYSVSAVTA